MIHTIYTMTIGRYGQLDKTKDARLLRRWFNPLPVGLFRKRIDKFFSEVREIMGTDNDNELNEEIDRAYSINQMLQVSILYDALYAAMVIKAGVDIVLLLVDRDPKDIQRLQFIKDEVKELTGIEVNDMQDLLKIQAEMTRLSDKFAERFKNPEPETEKASFMRGVMAVFSLMEMPYNDRMTIAEFSELKHLADDRRKQLEKQLDKYGST